jgi:hypothetical protein
MDLIATGTYPGTQYLADSSGPYHEDREVTLTGGPGSQMYRVYNAAFDSSLHKWARKDSTLPAYATVQNPDGSIHYYKLNTTTGLWEGSDNNSIYNAADYGMSTTDTSGGVNNLGNPGDWNSGRKICYPISLPSYDPPSCSHILVSISS